ncbi:MAG TPA: cupin domain-containing protein [Caulobacterales bacterium]|nr:cupin domain-containing protein [Caulobacterales bacterium]
MAKKSDKAKKGEGKKAKKAEAVGGVDAANPHVLRARNIGAMQQTFSHPWNPNSQITGVQLSRQLGLKRAGVSIARIAPGKESFVPHAHHREEEWLYILMGEGLALIGEENVRVGAGDFIAFPAPQVTHHLTNVGGEDLVYLMGGEHAKMDVVDFPTLAKRTVRLGDRVTVYDAESGVELSMPKPAKKAKK